MKPCFPFLAAVSAMLWPLSPTFAGGFPVVDVAHIASNRIAHATDYVQQILHEANQQTQILKEIEQIEQLYTQIDQLTTQIAQVDDYLDRFGDPETILDLAGLDELLSQLGQATDNLDVAERMRDVTGRGIFDFSGGGIYKEIKPDMEIDGEEFAREASRYKAEDAVRETVDEFRAKKLEVIERRDILKEEVGSTVEAIRTATTDSEVKKLTGVLLGQQTELQAIDRELEIAASENAARDLENANQRRADAKARAEAEAKRFEVGSLRDLDTYQLDQSIYGW
jgi:hypothetical protein